MKKLLLSVLSALLCFGNAALSQEINFSVKKIWDNGEYCSFPSILKYKGKYYISFREGRGHVFDENGKAEGKVRILVSDDCINWKSAAFLSKTGYDLRDPKLSETADGRLMVIIGGSVYKDKVLQAQIPQVSFSSDGVNFSAPQPIKMDARVNPNHSWLWRVTWNDGVGYGVTYSTSTENKHQLNLLKTTDGLNYDFVSHFDIPDFPNETTVRFLSDGRMLMLIRRDAGDRHAYWGVGKPPYTTDWDLKPMEMFVGGPDFIPVDDNFCIAGGRSVFIPSSPKTVLYSGDMSGNFKETVVLPSGGDTSYPGFLIEGDNVWVVYYSTHETKMASIYLAKIPLRVFRN